MDAIKPKMSLVDDTIPDRFRIKTEIAVPGFQTIISVTTSVFTEFAMKHCS